MFADLNAIFGAGTAGTDTVRGNYEGGAAGDQTWDQVGKSALGSLTRREQEIALMAARGLSKREIAETLFLSPRTIGNHINHVYGKLGISSREELRAAVGVGPSD